MTHPTRRIFLGIVGLLTVSFTNEAMAVVRPTPTSVYVLPASADMTPLPLLVRNYLTAIKFRDDVKTQRAKAGDLKKFQAFLAYRFEVEKPTWKDVTLLRLETFREDRLRVEKPSTVARRCSTLRDFCRHSAEVYRVVSPALDLRDPKLPSPTFKGVSEAQYEKLQQVLEEANEDGQLDSYDVRPLIDWIERAARVMAFSVDDLEIYYGEEDARARKMRLLLAEVE